MLVDVIQVLLTVCLEKSSHLWKHVKYFCIILSWEFFWSNGWNIISCSPGIISVAASSTVTILLALTGPVTFTWSNLSSSCSDMCLSVSFLIPWIGWYSSCICLEQRDSGEWPRWRGLFCLLSICPDTRKQERAAENLLT